ncbi:hypothetical protein [Paramuribaculum intestinale]|uniref:hypothetical protein n=1 Tax=Paramuribaculum intestinale TaxID=2094151 RepID=UPI0025A9B739|nr:hypothetical protein [Paramuribaculum intestinale]
MKLIIEITDCLDVREANNPCAYSYSAALGASVQSIIDRSLEQLSSDGRFREALAVARLSELATQIRRLVKSYYLSSAPADLQISRKSDKSQQV